MKIIKNTKGFTLVEMIVYIAISGIVLVSILNFSWNIIGSGVQVDVSSEVTQNARLTLNKISQAVKSADDIILTSSTFDIHPAVLTLDKAGVGTDIIFDTYQKQVNISGQDVTIRKLRYTNGANQAVDLTSDKIDLTNFVITNLTRDDEAANINIQLTFQYLNPGNDNQRDRSLDLETSVSIRTQ